MRVMPPPEIRQLYDEVWPYMELRYPPGYVLKESAPPEIVEMYNRIMDWSFEHARK